MTRDLLALALAASLGMLMVAYAPAPTLAPCATEDSAGPCYWDAATMGNGEGRRFTVDSRQVVTYAVTR